MKTNEAIGNLFTLLLQNVAWVNVGDASGLQPSATAGSLYFSFHTAWPRNTGDQTTHEAAYAGYARVGVSRSGAQFTVATPQADNTNQISFPRCTSGSETEMFIGIGTDPTGAGHLLYSGPITSAFYGFTAATVTTPTVGSGRLTYLGTIASLFYGSAGATSNNIMVPGSSFSVDDRIAFFSVNSDIPLPTGITEGQVYYVKTAAGEVVTISATSGGSVVAISASGAGVACKVVPFLISAGDTPALAAAQVRLLER